MAHSIDIPGTGAAVPETVLTNEQLAAMVDIDPEWIQARTGIRERRIADDRTATSDLATTAAQRAIAAAGISAKEIGMVICATVTPDTMFPRQRALSRIVFVLGTRARLISPPVAAALSMGSPAQSPCCRLAYAVMRW